MELFLLEMYFYEVDEITKLVSGPGVEERLCWCGQKTPLTVNLSAERCKDMTGDAAIILNRK